MDNLRRGIKWCIAVVKQASRSSDSHEAQDVQSHLIKSHLIKSHLTESHLTESHLVG